MQIVVVAAFILIRTFRSTQAAATAAIVPLPATIAIYVLLGGLLTYVSAAMARRALAGHFYRRKRALTHHRRRWLIIQLYLLAGLAALLTLGWAGFVQERLGAYVGLLQDAVLLSPLLAAIILNWLLEYPLHCHLRASTGAVPLKTWSLGQYIIFNLRHNVLFMAVPIAMILLGQDLFSAYGLPWIDAHSGDALGRDGMLLVAGAGSLALAAGGFLVAPVVVVRVLKTTSLPAGELRSSLLEMLRALGLKCRNILLWQSSGVVANAAVMGLAPSVRYVLLSDGLLENMDQKRLLAIFAHEAGHISSHHLLYSAMFALGSSAAVIALGGLLLGWIELPPWAQWCGDVSVLAALAAAWGLGFGAISRRFERQSDVLAAWVAGGSCRDGRRRLVTAEGAAVFAAALGQVATLNGIDDSQPNWRHGSIRSRIDYILNLGGSSTQQADDSVRLIKRLLWLLCAVAGAANVAMFVLTS